MKRRATKLERRAALRRRVLLAGWLLGACVILARSAALQVVEGSEWRGVALNQHRKTVQVPAARGTILDRDGVPMAVSQERFRVSVAPPELRDADEAAALLSEALGLGEREAGRVTRSKKRWVVLGGHHPPSVKELLGGVRGIYLERDLPRYYPHGDLARAVLGNVRDGKGAGGVEQAFDETLNGRPGEEIQARDSGGNPVPGETVLVEAPVTGGEVVLTLDMDLQEIAHEALSHQLEETGARRGDLLITDPNTGEILAMVSLPGGPGAGMAALTTPYEPGSTLKPFTVAALLNHRAATMEDSVDTGMGTWTVAGRTLHDVHPKTGYLTLGESLRYSSNVGVAKMAQGLTPAQQYENLRDFGFGVITGIGVPGEASGILRRPDRWSGQSAASLAIGYEISVTPLQMAMAYGALANGGKLMEPRLVREVRDGRGKVLERNRPRMVRRVVPKRVTKEITPVLVEVVDQGTGTRARLSTFSVAGKSGTARAYDPSGGYSQGGYHSSFIGFFPAENPQMVILVKLERPQGAYYGGATAAPVTRATLEAVLAARRAPIDRSALASMARRPDSSPSVPAVRFASRGVEPPAPPSETPADPDGAAIPVPDVSGLTARAAVRRLHALGLRVSWTTDGTISGTHPVAGTRLAPGDTVRLRAYRGDDG
jgi:cell division protein FtsI (penicillin-binding protein 3)